MNDNINMDSTIAESMNDNINMDSTIAESMNDNSLCVIHWLCYSTVHVYVVIHWLCYSTVHVYVVIHWLCYSTVHVYVVINFVLVCGAFEWKNICSCFFIVCLHRSVLMLEIWFGVVIPLTNLTLPHLCACPNPELEFQTSYDMFFF
jgi:hypothetical protein